MCVCVCVLVYIYYTYIYRYTATFNIQPISQNVSINQKANFSCSPPVTGDIVHLEWRFCSQFAQQGNSECKNVKQLSTDGSETIIDPEIDDSATPELYYLIVLMKDSLHLLNELNNSLIYCRALYDGVKPIDSTNATLLFQGQLCNKNN